MSFNSLVEFKTFQLKFWNPIEPGEKDAAKGSTQNEQINCLTMNWMRRKKQQSVTLFLIRVWIDKENQQWKWKIRPVSDLPRRFYLQNQKEDEKFVKISFKDVLKEIKSNLFDIQEFIGVILFRKLRVK